jgi:hypothetical protein
MLFDQVVDLRQVSGDDQAGSCQTNDVTDSHDGFPGSEDADIERKSTLSSTSVSRLTARLPSMSVSARRTS